jgi:spore coat polysaccharide biosynthesis protein SpsF (cytidylyltransferase family)
MSSTRFPGKVLAPFRDRPLIAHLLEKVAQVLPPSHVVVATSCEPADDPVAFYVRDLGISVFRGPLDNVFRRFQLCLETYPCTWFFRICADSPLLYGALLQAVMTYRHRFDLDLVTNVYPRTFPKGQSVEMIRAATFAAIDCDCLTTEEQEHVTKYFYNQPGRFNMLNVDSGNAALAKMSFVVDTIEDLSRLEKLTGDDPLLMECLKRLT